MGKEVFVNEIRIWMLDLIWKVGGNNIWDVTDVSILPHRFFRYVLVASRPKNHAQNLNAGRESSQMRKKVGFFGVSYGTVDGRNPANHLTSSLSHYLQSLIHPRWCRNSSINSMVELFMSLLLASWKKWIRGGASESAGCFGKFICDNRLKTKGISFWRID